MAGKGMKWLLPLIQFGLMTFGDANSQTNDPNWDGCITNNPSAEQQILSCSAVISRGDREGMYSLARAHTERGNLYNFLRNYPAAIADYNEAIRLEPEESDAYHGRAQVYSILGRHYDAIGDYNNLLRLARGQPSASIYYNRGRSFIRVREFSRALSDFDRALQLEPSQIFIRRNKAEAHFWLGQYDLALSEINASMRSSQIIPRDYVIRGSANLYLRNFDAAMSDLNRAIQEDGQSAGGYFYRAELHRVNRRYREAIIDYNAALRINPNYSSAFEGRGNAQNGLGNTTAAAADAQRAAEIRARN